ncbi:TetR/AcrR family transcriptional regulator [Tateyamaria sp. ANG-S1]|uniref:TetR/AcrR family transcriptional regulator n=1 Tax=Tateyamaria sp. ANG-S1 TaxID=1577905 RepID=UPI0005805407|nr:TetR/AcrR family transcriptional regulator [Tateyamaria sp. ANG-S1]KIC48652.1 hypothetical protein RA29_13130 [Tateyamaria sp. ANG-S1]
MAQAKTSTATRAYTRSGRDGARVWIIGALDMLVRGGVGAIKVERLASEINVSKGSFYWFFRNTDELLRRSLEHWREHLNNAVFEEVRASQGPVQDRLCDMVDMVLQSRLGRYDAAIRAWATTDQNVQAIVSEVDQERLAFLVELFEEAGLAPDLAAQNAHLFYRAFIAESYLRMYPGAAKKGAYLKDLLGILLTAPASQNYRE